MLNVIITILIFLFVFISYDELRKRIIERKMRNFDRPKQVPILGAACRFFGKSNDEIIDVIFRIYNEVKTSPFFLWLGPILFIGVTNPADIQIVLKSEHCVNKPYFYEHLRCKTSIMVSNRNVWKPHRRALDAAFSRKMLDTYVPLLNGKSRILLKQIEPFVNEPGDLYRTIFICMIDMVLRTTMGTDTTIQSERGAFFYKIIKFLMNNIQYRMVRFWFRWDFIYSWSKVSRNEQIPLKIGNSLIDDVYTSKVKELESLRAQGIDRLKDVKNKNATNVIEKCLILEQEGTFTHENVMDTIRVILLAGVDTSTMTVFGTLLLLAMNPKHQDLVVEELRSIFDSADSDVTQDDLSRMQYLERVIKESLRLLPPGVFFGRKPTADIEVSRGTIPKGAMILINIMHLHRNPEIWGENVLEFDPDRFLPENVATRPQFSYIPFAAGVRTCIGAKYAIMSAKITLAHLLRSYKFTTDLKFEEIRVKTHLVLEVTNEKPLRIENRHF